MRRQDRVFSLDSSDIARSWDVSKPDKTKEEIVTTFEKYARKKACVKVEYLDYESTIGYKAKFEDNKSLTIIIGRNDVENNMAYISRLDSSKKAKDIINQKKIIFTGAALATVLSIGGFVLTKVPVKTQIVQTIDNMIEKDNERFKEEQHTEEISDLLNKNNSVIWIDDSSEQETKEQVKDIENKQYEQINNEQQQMQQLLNDDFNNQFSGYDDSLKTK